MVVYRAAATDKRPGAPPSESDSYIAEILAPGSEAVAGFAIDQDQERYALSQQMIIVKTERLIAKRHRDRGNFLLGRRGQEVEDVGGGHACCC